MENLLLNQFNTIITAKWPSTQIEESYDNLTQRELFELAYHTCNSVAMRSILIKLSRSENKGSFQAVLYSNTKKFTNIEALENTLRITKYFPEGSTGDKLTTEIHPKLKSRKTKFASKDSAMKPISLKQY